MQATKQIAFSSVFHAFFFLVNIIVLILNLILINQKRYLKQIANVTT